MLKSVDANGVTSIQKALAREGFFKGASDGQKSDALTDALLDFQTAKNLARRGFTPVSYTHLDVYKRQAGDS